MSDPGGGRAPPILVQAARLIAAGQGSAAIALLRAATEGATPSPTAWHGMATLLQAQGDMAGAEAAWREALKAEPRMAAALIGLSAILETSSRRAEARALLEGGPEDSVTGIVAERLGAMRLADGDAAGAEAVLRIAVATEGSTAGASYALGDALRAQGRAPEAVEIGEALVEREPTSSMALAWLGVVLMECGRHAEAADALGRAAAAEAPPPWAPMRRAEALFRAGEPAACIEATRAALALTPDDPVQMALAAYLLRRSGAEDEAARLFAEAIARDPMSEGVRLLESGSLLEERRAEEAAVAAFRAVEVLSDRCDIVDRYGHILLELEQNDTAAEAFSAVLAMDARYLRAWVGLCEAERKRKRIKEAVAAFRKVCELNPDEATLRYLRYRLYGEVA